MELNFRSRHKNDKEFVFDLFCEHKVIELNATAWPDEIKSQLISMQFSVFEKSIYSEYPDLEDKIVCMDTSDPIGRIVLSNTASEIILLYISIQKKYQGIGIGKLILKFLINESRLHKKSLTLKVSKENPAYKLYLKIGFRVISENVTKYTMTYSG